jgi:DNA processing protein
VNTVPLDDATARRALSGVRELDDGVIDAYARAVWSVLTEPGDGVAGQLVAALGPAGALDRLQSGAGALSGVADIAPREVHAARARWMPRLDVTTVDRAFTLARRARVRLMTPADEEWPERLSDLGEHGPHVLWARGDPGHLAHPVAVAIVGARAATGYGDHVAGELAAGLAADGVSVVSGAAYGIDGSAHRAALGAGGSTIALLAGGVDRPYPSGHADLIDRIAARGAVLSETPCGTVPSKWRFLARNRLIAALSDATIVVEAGVRSGSLNTAAHAAAIGRPLGAVPGPVTSAASAGCHRILREYDGVCVTGVDDARELLGLSTSARRPTSDRTGDMTRILDAASTRVTRSAAEIARRAGLAQSETEALLGIAELGGDVQRGDGGWRRTPTR